MVESMCYKFGKYCFLIHCGQNNWYSAKKLCQRHSANLAILPSKECITKVAEYIEEQKNPCSHFWIGMATFSWNGKNGKQI